MEKPKNWFLFQKKLNWGSVFTFQVPSRYGISWPKKILKICDQNSDFHLQNPSAPRLDFESLKNLQRTLFFHSVQFLGQTVIIWRSKGNKSKMTIFTEKIHHRPFESYKNGQYHPIGLKISHHTQIEQGFRRSRESKNRRLLFTSPIFSDNHS